MFKLTQVLLQRRGQHNQTAEHVARGKRATAADSGDIISPTAEVPKRQNSSLAGDYIPKYTHLLHCVTHMQLQSPCNEIFPSYFLLYELKHWINHNESKLKQVWIPLHMQIVISFCSNKSQNMLTRSRSGTKGRLLSSAQEEKYEPVCHSSRALSDCDFQSTKQV